MAYDIPMQTATTRRWRRLSAVALATALALHTVLPWYHALTADHAAGAHACCAHDHGHREPAASEAQRGLVAPEAPEEACWICQSLVSLLHHADALYGGALVPQAPPVSACTAAGRSTVYTHLNPACRSQAPPVRV